jgi:hypothetical protein
LAGSIIATNALPPKQAPPFAHSRQEHVVVRLPCEYRRTQSPNGFAPNPMSSGCRRRFVLSQTLSNEVFGTDRRLVWRSAPKCTSQSSWEKYRGFSILWTSAANRYPMNVPQSLQLGRKPMGSTGIRGTERISKTGWRRGWDSNPRDPFRPNGFQDRRFQPLTHPSGCLEFNRRTPPFHNGRVGHSTNRFSWCVSGFCCRAARPVAGLRQVS